MKKLYTLLTTLVLIFNTQGNQVLAEGHADDDHGHSHHSHTPHSGVVAPFTNSGKKAGVLELKLHDDKGDLELWLTQKDGKTPFDLPLDSIITVRFTELGNQAVQLQVRNTTSNEDEDGKANIRGNKTHYFIFPGDTGVDASFLVGKEFSSDVFVSFLVGGEAYTSSTFTLKPHTH